MNPCWIFIIPVGFLVYGIYLEHAHHQHKKAVGERCLMIRRALHQALADIRKSK